MPDGKHPTPFLNVNIVNVLTKHQLRCLGHTLQIIENQEENIDLLYTSWVAEDFTVGSYRIFQ